MTPIKAIRQHCLDCCCGSAKVVKYCTNDGVNSTRCHLWPLRFGKRPKTAARIYGERFLDPNQMPSAEVSLDDVEVGGRPVDRPVGVCKKKRSSVGESCGESHDTGQGETP